MCSSLGFLVIILLLNTVAGWPVDEVIRQLNRDLDRQLNVYFDCQDQELSIDQSVSALHLNTYLPMERLMGRFSENALIIACLSETTENQTLAGVKEFLWALQHLPVLYITRNRAVDFGKALKQGFLHVLALDVTNGSLFTYKPYPHIELHQVEEIKDFRHLTKLRNLQGEPVRISVETMSPRCFHYKNRHGKEVYAGYMYKLIQGFINTYNGTETYVLKDQDPIPYTIGFKILQNGDVDIVPRILFNFNWTYFYRSYVLYNVNSYFIVPWAEPLPKSLYFIRTFRCNVWIALILSFIYASIGIWWIKFRKQNAASTSLASTFMDVLQLMVQLPNHNRWHFSLGLRHVLPFLVLFPVGFVLTNMYTAQLSSSLTTGLYKQQIDSFDDMVNGKFNLLLESLDTEVLLSMSKRNYIQPGLQNIVRETSLEEVLYLRKNLNTSYSYLAFGDRIEFELSQQQYLRVPLFKILPEIFVQRLFFIPLRHGLPYVELFNDYLQRIWESGIYQKLRLNAYLEGISSGEITFRKSTTWETQVFNMEFYYFAYILLAVGWLFGGVIFMIEKWRG
ncbi:uncharacterized protein Dana_GF20056 [Drosophila ananassae]|uniref:Ionotropic glutamate receptor C-terminal domain-containing protein n=1 Tax=Drosophila ananassae TaxID=7217 RepID=B3M5B1_DROAN|nr:uncharacterized protein LOC6502780 [Drosophila ananassae]EDV40616.1 uncharacterized protein Dana_GF20056 [Drosophila ananassae]